MTLLNVEDLVKKAAYVESKAQTVRVAERGPVFAGKQPAAVREGVFQLVAVVVGLFGAQDGGDFRQFQVSDAGQLVHDLLLLEGDLAVVGECLPGTAATDAEVPAEWRKAERGRGYHLHDEPLGIAAADLVDLYVHYISGDCLFHENDFAVDMGQAVSFGRGRLDRDVFQTGF